MDDIEGLEPEEVKEVTDWETEAKRLRDQNKELLTEVKQARAARRQQFLAAHTEFTEEDIKGVNLAQLETLLSKVAKPTAPAEAEAPKEPTPEAPEAQALAQAANLSGPPGVPQKKYTLDEAKKLSWDQRRQAIEQGLVEGVSL